jgi:hypothetical protein
VLFHNSQVVHSLGHGLHLVPPFCNTETLTRTKLGDAGAAAADWAAGTRDTRIAGAEDTATAGIRRRERDEEEVSGGWLGYTGRGGGGKEGE